ncbi:MAG: HypC/HybG/HupF family hydrogenase formation chaperone [Patescibacteria group bacterium]
MCLAVSGKIKKKQGKNAFVDFNGIIKKIKIDLTPEVKIGDYVIVHAGFSIQKIDKKEANELFKMQNILC